MQLKEPEDNSTINLVLVFVLFVLLAAIAGILTYFLWWKPKVNHEIQLANMISLENVKAQNPWLSNVTLKAPGLIRFSRNENDGSVTATAEGDGVDFNDPTTPPSVERISITASRFSTIITYYPRKAVQ